MFLLYCVIPLPIIFSEKAIEYDVDNPRTRIANKRILKSLEKAVPLDWSPIIHLIAELNYNGKKMDNYIFFLPSFLFPEVGI